MGKDGKIEKIVGIERQEGSEEIIEKEKKEKEIGYI